MRFNGICLVTRDMPRLRGFYTTILGVEAEGDDTFTLLSTQGAVLSLFSEEGMEHLAPGSMQNSGCGRYTLEFEVKNVDEEYERLKGMEVAFVKPPTTQTWERRSVWFRDPEGNIINFFTKVES